MKNIETPNLYIKSWCGDLEAGALEQAMHIAQLPFAFRHVALMPDAHQGFGMPIGGVLATRDTIIPNAVGVDIGCGMLACKTKLQEISRDEIKKVLGIVRRIVPVGFNHRKTPLDINEPPAQRHAPIANEEYESARYQVGTLGGGNHFIEIQRGSDGCIWYMIHSGSRNIGKKVCDYYNKLAKSLNSRRSQMVPREWDLAYLPVESDEGVQYVQEMQYCQEFAYKNREVMAGLIADAFAEATSGFDVQKTINVHHNYAHLEEHFGERVWVHRKGAISAHKGAVGIIPGSQGSKSFITRGLGNPESFSSCSHGAGRRMGRKEAQRTLSLSDEIKHMDDLGIVHGIRGAGDLDEAAGAYKDIDAVMAEQADLVEIEVELTPLGVIKA